MRLNSTTRSFTFKMVDTTKDHTGLMRYFDSISMMGKHYTFVPLFNGVPIRENKNRVLRRHFTIANCMQKDFYHSLLQAITRRGTFDGSPSSRTKREKSTSALRSTVLGRE